MISLSDFNAENCHSFFFRFPTGTPYFLAPEIIAQEDGYNHKVDIWALGISVIQLAEMNPPLSDVNPMRALLLITYAESARQRARFS